MPSPAINTLLSSNAAVASSNYTAPPTFAQFGEAMKTAGPDSARLCIVTCVDPRCDANQFYALPSHPKIFSIVLRNAGGSPRKALPDILAIDTLVHFTDLLVVRHTDCGSLIFRDNDIRAELKARLSSSSANETMLGQELDGMCFGECTTSAAEMCREDVQWLKNNVLVREDLRAGIWGGVFDLSTGRVEGVA
ncbi:uncharacterized protein HMPREF1541_03125 [Cyphellophora europaea CBS 101466]|uniref:Carbonic anhydrase n=1 Tax=Cyphellophora europaea (strain CBS 101466) TaxID=1220924 RepID=W2RXY5_CYPE1|nr:uncharacterized protein HMPREF1541_03125 [Cyphellophora europaea CBS 101466]ETN41190.1 hypothetical protein HMPREF1541_03125 [Cyphellophora europaea CBS 101466]